MADLDDIVRTLGVLSKSNTVEGYARDHGCPKCGAFSMGRKQYDAVNEQMRARCHSCGYVDISAPLDRRQR